MKIKKTKIILLIITNLNLLLAYSQEIKTYKGIYFNGNAEYQYYENSEKERIKNGFFKYTWKEELSSGYIRTKHISGNYINNKQNGEWFFETKLSNPKLKFDNPTEKTIKINFIDNKKNGVCELQNYNFPVKEINKNGVINRKLDESFKCNFLNDTLVNVVAKGDYVSGKTDDKGNFIGDWKIIGDLLKQKKNDREIYYTFKDNILIKLIDSKTSTGEIYSKYFPNFDINNFKVFIDSNIKKYYNSVNLRNNKIAGIEINENYKENYILGIDNSLNELINLINLYKYRIDEYFNIYNKDENNYFGESIRIKVPEVLIEKN